MRVGSAMVPTSIKVEKDATGSTTTINNCGKLHIKK